MEWVHCDGGEEDAALNLHQRQLIRPWYQQNMSRSASAGTIYRPITDPQCLTAWKHAPWWWGGDKTRRTWVQGVTVPGGAGFLLF